VKGIYSSKNGYSKECWWPDGYNTQKHKLSVINLEYIKDSIVWDVDRENLTIKSLRPTLIKDTPHYQYALGNKQPYVEYLEKCRHITWARSAINQQDMKIEQMFEKFDKLLDSEHLYLQPPYENKYIIVNHRASLIDGLHRSVCLLVNGINEVPAAVVGL